MKIIHEREKCIGCGSCAAVCPKYWEMVKDGKSKLKNSKINSRNANYELEVKETDCNQEAVDTCPVQCIIIKK